MKRFSIALLCIAFFISSCKKSTPAPAPTSSFDIGNSTESSITISQYYTGSLINNSTNGVSYTWDFGDGTTSTEKQPVYTAIKTGQFTLSLKVINADGQTSVATKQVKVVAPVMNQITVTNLYFDQPAFTTTPVLTKADLWVEITKREKGVTYKSLSNGSFDAPVVFKSLVYKDATAAAVPIALGVPQKFALDLNGIMRNDQSYGVQLYAKDATGTYLIACSDWSGSGFSFSGNINLTAFTWTTGAGGNNITLSGYYQ